MGPRSSLPQRITALLALATAAAVAPAQEPGELFESVVEVLEQRFQGQEFRRAVLPGLVARFRPAAEAAESLAAECAVVDGLLSHVPSSHLALLSERAQRGMLKELSSRPQWMLGMQIKQRASRFFACKVLEGGPAARAGVRRGDRIVSIDRVAPQHSERRGRRTDDAYLPDAPLYPLLVDAKASDAVRLVVERRPGEQLAMVVESARYSALQAARASARVIESGGRRFGYVHFWYIHAGCVALLNKLVDGAFADCDAMILDLRGRGGSAREAQRILSFFTSRRRPWQRPFVVLQDRDSRSAKEMLSYEFKQRKAGLIIGERSAGALVPAMFQRVGQGMVLMYPGPKIRKYSAAVEGIGVAPDIEVRYPLPFSAGADPILRRAVRHLASGARSPAASRR